MNSRFAGALTAVSALGLWCIGLTAGASTSVSDGSGWVETQVNLAVRVLPKDGSLTVHGDATLVLQNPTSNGPALWVNYGAYSKRPVMAFTSLSGPAGTTSDINVTDPRYPGTLFGVVHLLQPASKGDTIRIVFDVKSLRGNAFTLTLADPVSFVGADNGWYPLTLANDGKLDANADASIGTTTFDVPLGYHSLSNGDLVAGYTQGSDEVESWHLRSPGSFAVGPYMITRHAIGSTQVSLYTLRGTDPRKRLKDITDVLSVLQQLYGPFPYHSYSIAEIPDKEVSWYGIAANDVSAERTSLFKLPDAQGYFAHEAGHAWWGNTIHQTGPGGLMMSEGLAQYSALSVRRIVNGSAAYLRSLNFSSDSSPYSGQGYFRSYFGTSQDNALSHLNSLRQSDYDLAIAKGVWFYHMLRERVGDRTFFETLRGLIQEFSGKEIRLDDLREAFIKAAPHAGLSEFFQQWLDRVGAPVITWDRTSGDRDEITLRQWQAGQPYQLPLPIAFNCGEKRFTQTILLTRRFETVRLRKGCSPTDVRLDPQFTLLLWRPIYSPTPPKMN